MAQMQLEKASVFTVIQHTSILLVNYNLSTTLPHEPPPSDTHVRPSSLPLPLPLPLLHTIMSPKGTSTRELLERATAKGYVLGITGAG